MSRRSAGSRGGSSTSAIPLPSSISGLHSWWRADSGITTATGVSQWASLVNGHNLVQATGANQPVVQTLAQLNNKPALYFDGTNDCLLSDEAIATWNFLHAGTGCTVFWVGISDTTNTNGSIISTIDPSGLTPGIWVRLTDSLSKVEIYKTGAGGVVNTSTLGPATSTLGHISDFSYVEGASPEYVFRVGGVSKATGASTNPPETGDANHTLSMGCLSNGNNYHKGHIAEVILFNRALTLSEKNQVLLYLRDRYAVTESNILALTPYSFAEADYYSVDGVSGKVAAFLDKVPSGTGIKAITPDHAYTQATSARQVVIPTAVATLGSRKAANFAATPTYVSNSPASSWGAHKSGGFTSVFVMDRTAVSGTQYVWATYNAAATGAAIYFTGSSVGHAIYNGGVITINASAGSEVTGPTFYSTVMAEANTPDATLRRRTATVHTANNTVGFDTGNPSATMTIGEIGGTPSGNALNAYVAMWLFFDRALTSDELAVVHAYIYQKYGVS